MWSGHHVRVGGDIADGNAVRTHKRAESVPRPETVEVRP